MNIPQLLIYSVAVFGLSYVVTKQDGPYHIFTRLTNWFGDTEHTDIDYFLQKTLKGNIYSILTCPYCLGVYISFLILISNLPSNISLQSILQYIINSFAVYGGHVVLTKLIIDRFEDE